MFGLSNRISSAPTERLPVVNTRPKREFGRNCSTMKNGSCELMMIMDILKHLFQQDSDYKIMLFGKRALKQSIYCINPSKGKHLSNTNDSVRVEFRK